MVFLRLLGMLWLFYVTARILRSLRDSVGRPPGSDPNVGAGPQGAPFDEYGPFGRFGPFGPFGAQNPHNRQNQGSPGGPGFDPRAAPGFDPRAGWYDPFAGGDPFAGQARPNPQRPAAAASPPSPYEILGVRPGASMADIRRAYQELVRQYHPDKVDGLGPELRALAEQRTKEITGAYNALKRRG